MRRPRPRQDRQTDRHQTDPAGQEDAVIDPADQLADQQHHQHHHDAARDDREAGQRRAKPSGPSPSAGKNTITTNSSALVMKL